ncbi:MAG: hypothetical protein M3Y19_10400 [Actinomycetota bacterium]|nr:hypothetical protein [Actinomycetota bacterium]
MTTATDPAPPEHAVGPALGTDLRRLSRIRLVGLFGACLAVGLWVLWRTGPGKVPYLALFESTARGWPTAPLPTDSQYILREPLGQIVYRLLPVHGTGVYLALHLVCLLVSATWLATWLCRRLGRESGLVACAIVALAPVAAVLLLWIGMYDAFSVLAWVAVLVTMGRRPGWQLAAGMLAGFQDFEQIGVGLLMVALLPQLARSAGLRPRAAQLIGGAVIGKLALEAYLRTVGAGSGSRLSYLERWDVFSGLLGSAGANAPLLVWSALAGLWGFALKALYDSWGGWTAQQRVGLIVAVLLWFASATLSADHSRVLAMTSFPLVVMGALAIAARWPWRALLPLPQTWLLVLAPPVVLLDYATLPMGVKPGTWGVWIF